MSYQKPYKGLKVIDFSQGVAGPYCGMLLAQHGAEVIKIEPKDGDWARNLGQEYGEHSAFSVAANLGKKSIIIDLKNKKSQSILDKIIKKVSSFDWSKIPDIKNWSKHEFWLPMNAKVKHRSRIKR